MGKYKDKFLFLRKNKHGFCGNGDDKNAAFPFYYFVMIPQ